MKKKLYIFAVMFLATVIVYGGSRINVYLSCCEKCTHSAHEAASAIPCCGDPHHINLCNAHEKEKECCKHHVQIENQHHCKYVERVTVDWQIAQSEKQVIAPVSLDLLVNFVHLAPLTIENSRDISPWLKAASQKPPNLSKETYFSLLNFLII